MKYNGYMLALISCLDSDINTIFWRM